MQPSSCRLGLTASKTRSFEVRLAPDLFRPAGAARLHAVLAGRRTLVVTTPTVDALHGARLRRLLAGLDLQPAWLTLACPETAKTLETVARIGEAAHESGLDRNGILIAFGGGVCSDLVTLAASLLRRGVAHLRLPTTLVGQIDAGIGIKGAANFGAAKNYLGCFHPPEAVIVDPGFLRTLPDAAIRQGLAEIIKIACLRDAPLFDLLRREGGRLARHGFRAATTDALWAIERAIAGMLDELAENPFEDRSHARAVDFGHSVSPTLEAATGYSLHHGFAVAIDIAFSAVLARRMGLLAADAAEAILALLAATDLPIAHPLLTPELVARAFASVTLHRGGALNLVLPTGIGAYTFVGSTTDIAPAWIEQTLAELNAMAPARASMAA